MSSDEDSPCQVYAVRSGNQLQVLESIKMFQLRYHSGDEHLRAFWTEILAFATTLEFQSESLQAEKSAKAFW